MESIGDRIRYLRTKAGLSQHALAAGADISVDVIRKLEQGIRASASIGTLHKIAAALDVDTADLLDKRAALPQNDQDSGVLAIRRVLTSVDDLMGDPEAGGEALSLAEAERTVNYLWGAYWAGRYDQLGILLPTALTQLRATCRAVPAADRSRAAEAMARGYQAAGDTLVHLGQTDAGWIAVREGLTAARAGDDALLDAGLRMSIAWQLLVQGRLGESERVAVAAADQVEPRGEVSDAQLAAYGILTATGATAVARTGRVERTDELLGVARDAAKRLGSEQSWHQTTFGPSKVVMMTVDCNVVLEQFGTAIDTAKTLPRDAPLPLATRARHMTDVAYSQTQLGHDEKALNTLLAIEGMAKDWIPYQTLVRQTVAQLRQHDRNRPYASRLHDLARRIGA